MLRAFLILLSLSSGVMAATPKQDKEQENPKPPPLGAPVELTGKALETPEVTFPDGRRQEAPPDDQCINASGPPFAQHAFSLHELRNENASEAICSFTFKNYKEVFPGIVQPTQACLHSFVKSIGGSKAGAEKKRGYLTCQMKGNQITPMSLGRNPPEKHGGDSKATSPPLLADIKFERDSRALVTAAIPLEMLKYKAHDVIKQNITKLPNMVSVQIPVMDFDAYVPNSPAMALKLQVIVSAGDILTVTCDATIRFALPAAQLQEVVVQNVGSEANCKNDGGDIAEKIAEWADLNTKLSNAIYSGLDEVLNKKVFRENETLKEWGNDDPDLLRFLPAAQIQGSYCDWRGKPGLCLRVAWPEKRAFATYEALLLGKAPKSTGPVKIPLANERFNKIRDFALEKQMNDFNGFKYPAGWRGTELEDADMAIFGGILCATGEPHGCDSIEHSFTNHRFYRSPRRAGEPETDQATFSGDQMKGVLHYFASTAPTADKTFADKKNMLGEYLDYIRNNPTKVPSGGEKNRGDGSLALETGYSICETYKPNFTCFIAGADWHILKIIAKKYGLEHKLPADLKEIEKRYAFSYDGVLWESMLTNSGYRLHLVANAIWLLKRLGITDYRLEKSLKLIAARQPKNPFFRYLAIGPDRKGQVSTDEKCGVKSDRVPGPEWAWQSPDKQKKWNTSMAWDCVAMYRLLGANYSPRQKPVPPPPRTPPRAPTPD